MSEQNIVTWNVPNILSVWLMAAFGATVVAFTFSALRKFSGAKSGKDYSNA
jgi:hypothetical protein